MGASFTSLNQNQSDPKYTPVTVYNCGSDAAVFNSYNWNDDYMTTSHEKGRNEWIQKNNYHTLYCDSDDGCRVWEGTDRKVEDGLKIRKDGTASWMGSYWKFGKHCTGLGRRLGQSHHDHFEENSPGIGEAALSHEVEQADMEMN